MTNETFQELQTALSQRKLAGTEISLCPLWWPLWPHHAKNSLYTCEEAAGSEMVHWRNMSSPMKEEPRPSVTMNYLALIGKPFMWSIKLVIWHTDTLSFFPKDLTVLYPPKQFSRPQYHTRGISSPLCNGEASAECHRPACWPLAGRRCWATPPSLIHNLHKRFRHGGNDIKRLLTKGTACHFHTFMQSNRLYLLSLIRNVSPHVGVVKGKPVDSVSSLKFLS